MAAVFWLAIIRGSYVIIRMGALALELTGIDTERANFQALSAFTNSGYTTRESEDMVKHSVRRRIISFMMILGNAGMVTTMGTFATSLITGDFIDTARNVGVILAGLLVLLWVARWQGLTRRLHDACQRWLARRYDFAAPSTEELLRVGQGYGLLRIQVEKGSPVAGHYLRELDLKPRMVQVLAIERGGRFIPIPVGEDKLQEGDHLIVYGTEGSINRVFHPDATSPIKILRDDAAAPPRAPEPAKKSKGEVQEVTEVNVPPEPTEVTSPPAGTTGSTPTPPAAS